MHPGGIRMVAGNLTQRARAPLDRKRPVHLVLKASCAKGKLSLLAHRLKVDRILNERAKQFHVTIHRQENMGNHLHIVASFARRDWFQNFLRTVTALIAREVTGARRGRPFGRRFWDELAFTRVVMGWRDLLGVRNYLEKNRIEREHGALSRRTVEEYEAALAQARRKGIDVWRILERQ